MEEYLCLHIQRVAKERCVGVSKPVGTHYMYSPVKSQQWLQRTPLPYYSLASRHVKPCRMEAECLCAVCVLSLTQRKLICKQAFQELWGPTGNPVNGKGYTCCCVSVPFRASTITATGVKTGLPTNWHHRVGLSWALSPATGPHCGCTGHSHHHTHSSSLSTE